MSNFSRLSYRAWHRFGNDMTADAALESIRRVYAVGYELPDGI